MVLVALSLVVPVPATVAHAAPPTVPSAASGGFPWGEPAYDSGWVDIAAGENLSMSHNLGGTTDDYVVDLQGRSSLGDRHAYYGGDLPESSTSTGFYWWRLDATTIDVYRTTGEVYTEQVRVRIWVVASANYDSGWATVAAGGSLTLEHDLGGDPDDYLVYLEMLAPYAGINQVGYGLDRWVDSEDNLRMMGAYWRELTGEHIKVYVGTELGFADSVRVRIWRAPAPDYDSGWVSMSQGASATLVHDLGGPWNDYLVDLQFKDTDGTGWVNQRGYGRDVYNLGGSWYYFGGFWRDLNSSEITLDRGSDDGNADQMRVRIWASSRPKYDSGWQPVDRDTTQRLMHDLGGDVDAYVVDLQFKDTPADGLGGHGVNQQYYGGDLRPGTYGAYWSDLSDVSIKLTRWSSDPRADEMRVRIWIAPFADYDSGWLAIAQDACSVLSHGAGDGVVYLEFYEAGIGLNHRHYGLDRTWYSTGSTFRERGAYWKGLEANSITVCRGTDDGAANNQRLRIWQRREPDYATGWRCFGAGSWHDIDHNLGLDPDGMVVEMQSWASGEGVNQANYGTDVFSLGGPITYEVGAYWRNLSSNSVTVVRGATDGDSSCVRVRIYLEAVTRVYLPVSLRSS
jgi:hypothetical protein